MERKQPYHYHKKKQENKKAIIHDFWNGGLFLRLMVLLAHRLLIDYNT